MVPFSDVTESLTAYLYNHIQIENTFPDLKSRTLCVDVSPKLKVCRYGIILFSNEEGRENETSDLLALLLLLPYIFLFSDFLSLLLSCFNQILDFGIYLCGRNTFGIKFLCFFHGIPGNQ